MDYTRKSIESASLSCVSWCVFITVSLLSPPSLMTCIIFTDTRNDYSNTLSHETIIFRQVVTNAQ